MHEPDIVERLEGLMERARRPGAEAADRYALRSEAELHLPELLSRLRSADGCRCGSCLECDVRDYHAYEGAYRRGIEDAAAYIEAQAKQAQDTVNLVRVQDSTLPITDPTFSCEGLRQIAATIRNLPAPPTTKEDEDV